MKIVALGRRLRSSALVPLLISITLPALAGAAGAPTADAAVVEGALGARLDAVAEQARAQGFHGVLLVAKEGRDVLLKGYGVANEAAGTPFAPSTVVPIGSCVKDFTKVAIYQLVEAGKLRLDDALGKFFPAAPADKREITVQQLLDHRAGLPLGVGLDETPLGKQEFLDRVFAAKLESAPGTAERYSNAGFSVLAAIVEQLSGEAFDAYVERAILRPLGLTDTGLLAPKFAPARLAHAYAGAIQAGQRLGPQEDRGTMLDRPHTAEGHGWALRGNGGYLSTVRDMARFFRGVRGDRLLRDPEHRDAVLPSGGPSVLAGSDLVSFFLFASYPGAGVEVVLATNHDTFKAPQLLEKLEPVLGVGGPREEDLGPAETALPDSGPGKTVAAYLEAFNRGEAEGMRAFLTAHAEASAGSPPMAKRLETFERMRGEMGHLEVQAVRRSPDGLVVDFATEHGERARFSFAIAAAPPYALRSLQVDLGGGGGGGRRRAGGGGEIASAPAVALPDSPRGRVVAAYLQAFDADDDAAMRAFFEQHAANGGDAPPLAQRLENTHRLRRTLGRLTVVAIEDRADGLVLTVRGEREGRAKLTFVLEDKEPFRFLGLRVEVG